jgi:hypothetical protein
VIKDEKPYINHKGDDFRCYLAGYLNPIQHKWSFVIDGVDSGIRHNERIDFMGITLTVCLSLRRDAVVTKPFNNVTGKETYIEAWLL